MTILAWVPDNQGDGRGCSLSFSNGNGHGGFSDRLDGDGTGDILAFPNGSGRGGFSMMATIPDGWGDGTCGDGNGNGSGTLYTRGDGYGAAYDNGNGYSGGGASDGSSGEADDIQVNYSDSRWRPS